MNNETKIVRTLSGQVVSDTCDKTITVLVERVKTHPLYHKKYTVSKKYRVHDPENTYKNGDIVEFVSCRPLSKDKHYIVLEKK